MLLDRGAQISLVALVVLLCAGCGWVGGASRPAWIMETAPNFLPRSTSSASARPIRARRPLNRPMRRCHEFLQAACMRRPQGLEFSLCRTAVKMHTDSN